MDNIDLIPKKPKEEPFWQELLFYVSFLVLAIVLLFCIGFAVLVKRSSLELKRVNQELSREKTPQELETEQYVLDYNKKVTAFKVVLKQRKPVSNVFDSLESQVHPNAYFTKMTFTASSNQLLINGLADNFQVLGEQALIFRENSLLQEVNLKQIGIGKNGGIEFSFELWLNQDIFTVKEEPETEETSAQEPLPTESAGPIAPLENSE